MENRDAILKKLEPLRDPFPKFYEKVHAELVRHLSYPVQDMEYVLPPASDDEIKVIEKRIGVPLPKSYQQFLRCTQGISTPIYVSRVSMQLHRGHPFVVDRSYLKGTICVAEYFLEADGDQLYLDARQGLINDEYPALYYAHDYAPEPRCLRKVANSFGEWLESL